MIKIRDSVMLIITPLGGGSAFDYYTIPQPSKLVSVQWAVTHDSVTDNDSLRCQIKRGTVQSLYSGAGFPVISEVRSQTNLVTSGLSQSAINFTDFLGGYLEFAPNEIIGLYGIAAGFGFITAILRFAD